MSHNPNSHADSADSKPSAPSAQGSEPPVVGLLFDAAQDALVRERLLPALADYPKQLVPYQVSSLPAWPEDTVVVVYVDDAALAHLIPEAAKRQWRLALLPHPGAVRARQCFGMRENLTEALEALVQALAAPSQEQRADVLFCNGQLVFHSVVVGKVFALGATGQPPGRVERLRSLWQVLCSSFGHLELSPYKLTTAKDKTLDTAALGVVVVEAGIGSLLARRILEDSARHDGMLHALVLVPRSRIELLRFVMASFFATGGRQRPPPFVGHLKTAALTISNAEPLDYLHDGVWRNANELTLDVQPQSLRVLAAPPSSSHEGKPSKEVHLAHGLPTGEARNALLGRALPWIHRATTEEFRDLYSSLRDNARPSQAYLTLMVLSTLLATLGLFANSAPVIIGAMILAPLMAPIISLSMAVVRQDQGLLINSLKTLSWGVGLALGCAVIMTWLIPLRSLTGEIAARLNPTLLDLGVALVSGVAGAYAHAREEVGNSLAGVAIAVALVPPLAVAGIGLGWGQWSVFQSAFLLFLTNLFGIVLAGNLTFLLLGFGPFRQAQRGLLAALVLVGVVSLPLGFGFTRMVEQQQMVRTLEALSFEGGTRIRAAAIDQGDPFSDFLDRAGNWLRFPPPDQSETPAKRPLRLTVQLAATELLDSAAVGRIKHAIELRLQRPVVLEAAVAIER